MEQKTHFNKLPKELIKLLFFGGYIDDPSLSNLVFAYPQFKDDEYVTKNNLILLYEAAQRGYCSKFLKNFLKREKISYSEINFKLCSQIAIGGNLETLQWARNNGFLWDEWSCNKNNNEVVIFISQL